MIVFKISMHAIPVKQLEIKQTLIAMIKPTETKMGCLSFDTFCDIQDENHFSLVSEWNTRKNLDAHLASHEFSVLLGIKTLLCEPFKIQIYVVSRKEITDVIRP